ncbi:ArsR/SmtB family transcription factor [Terrisporobacter glycolicus]|uniref:Arsenic resistance transcriptional regulator ArsR1 n=1 Tax=Terrisporobacter glycolicus ATCC 14880 = DSM 1288 TaxID=1121315 RepID=A0ABZ2EW29_9FIRM|nr:metalloregulator ArsR/SmtB family transcription factor [Terrisporobacter glycolicus]
MELIQMLKALGDDTRLRIINILSHGDLCVCEIEVVLGISQSNASRHLNKLMNAKLVNYYKEAKYVYYKINEETINEHKFLKDIIEKELCNIEKLNNDYENLIKLKNEGMCCESIEKVKNQEGMR